MLTVAAASGWKRGGEMGGGRERESNREGVRQRDVAAVGAAAAAASEDFVIDATDDGV